MSKLADHIQRMKSSGFHITSRNVVENAGKEELIEYIDYLRNELNFKHNQLHDEIVTSVTAQVQNTEYEKVINKQEKKINTLKKQRNEKTKKVYRLTRELEKISK